MASRADALATNINLSKFGEATELKKRLWFTIGVLIVFRMLSFIPLPGIDPTALGLLANQTRGGVLDFFNTFSGGSLARMSIIALGVMPYITASIVVQLATSLSPTLNAIKKEGESGRKRLNQYTRYGTVALTAIQGWFIAVGLESFGAQQGVQAVVDPGLLFRVTAVISLIGGTMFLMWLGEQITSRGVGNGVSLIIFAGIVSVFPNYLRQAFALAQTGAISGGALLMIGALVIGVTVAIVFMERSQRRLLVQYPKRQVGNRMFGGDTSFLPLKINTSGVIPPIFASSLLLLPATVMGFAATANLPPWLQWLPSAVGQLQHGQPLFMVLYGALIVFFCFFYTSVVFNPEDTAENLRKYGGFMPGIRPGRRTAEYLDFVLTRLTVIGAAYIAVVCLLPELLIGFYNMPFYMGGTSVLIVVSVTMDTVTQIQSHLLAHQYEGLIKKSKLRGNRGR
jgi:preprotein translocase subunit SecY